MKKFILSILSTVLILSMACSQTFAYLPKDPNCYDASVLLNADSVDIKKFSRACKCKTCELTIVRFDAIDKLVPSKNYSANITNKYNVMWNEQKGAVISETTRDGGLALFGASNILYFISAAAWAPPVAIGGAIFAGVVTIGGEVAKLIFLSNKEMNQRDIELIINQLQMLSSDITNKNIREKTTFNYQLIIVLRMPARIHNLCIKKV